jgi:hypothetical protein
MTGDFRGKKFRLRANNPGEHRIIWWAAIFGALSESEQAGSLK